MIRVNKSEVRILSFKVYDSKHEDALKDIKIFGNYNLLIIAWMVIYRNDRSMLKRISWDGFILQRNWMVINNNDHNICNWSYSFSHSKVLLLKDFRINGLIDGFLSRYNGWCFQSIGLSTHIDHNELPKTLDWGWRNHQPYIHSYLYLIKWRW